MVGARAPATRRRSPRFTDRHSSDQSAQGSPLGCFFAHDGPGGRPIEVSEQNFFAELKRRNVYKVAVAYVVVGWLVIQVSSTVLPTFHAPEWVVQTLVVLVAIGFPIALVIAWAFELTPEGLKRAEDVDPATEKRRK